MPHRWYDHAPDIFSVTRDHRRLDNLQAFTNQYYYQQTALRPGERVTHAFRLSRIVRLPEGAGRLGRYSIKSEAFVDDGRARPVVGPPGVVWICDTAPEPEGQPRALESERELQAAAAYLGLRTATPYDRLVLLRRAAKAGEKALWRLVPAADDAYAVAELLRELPAYLLQAEGLLALLKSRDLAVRRAALQALARLGPDEAAAGRLEGFLKGQRDQPSLEHGKRALQALRGR